MSLVIINIVTIWQSWIIFSPCFSCLSVFLSLITFYIWLALMGIYLFQSHSIRLYSHSICVHLSSLLLYSGPLGFCLCSLVFTGVHLCLLIFTCALLAFTHVSLCSTCVHWPSLCSTCIYWCLFVFLICSLMFTCVHLFSNSCFALVFVISMYCYTICFEKYGNWIK